MNKNVETYARQRFISCLDTIKSDMNNRDLYIWGLGDGGRIAIEELKIKNIKIAAVISGNKNDTGKEFCGYKEKWQKLSRAYDIFKALTNDLV